MARVLVVDDDNAVRKLLVSLLKAEGHEVSEHATGMGVARDHQATPYDLIVLDIIMPDKEGLETLMELRGCTPPARVLAISGGGADGSLDFLPVAKKLGARGALKKPFNRQEFLEACRSALAD